MTEFLKNNPIALRHCLLYGFLQGKPIKRAFSDFYKAVGNDVIKKKSFEFWFDKFFWGIFDDAIEPITDMRDIFRNDKHALRTCILFESLKYKRRERNIITYFLKGYRELVYRRSISAHKNFCEVIGEDVMEYREFDFWFHRFLDGEIDLNFERDKNKKIYELVDMPLDIMRNIVEYLDISIDQKLFHPKMILQVDDSAVYISYGIYNRAKLYKHWTSENVWKEAIQDFKAVLSYPKLHLENLKIAFYTKSSTLIAKIADELVSTFQFHIKNLCFEAPSIDPLLKILPSFLPGYLTTINVYVEEMDDTIMEKVSELEQWKQATRVSVNPDLDLGW